MSRLNKLLFGMAAIVVLALVTPGVKAGPSACDGVAGNLVVNCGFETGTLTGWTQSGNPGFTTVVSSLVNSGSFAGSFGPVGSIGSIEQNIATVVGQQYFVSFFLTNSGGTPNVFQLFWNGALAAQLIDQGGFSFSPAQGVLTATSALTNIRFSFRQDPGFWGFDDVVVRSVNGSVPVPEPMTMLLLGSGLAGIGMKLRRRRAKR